jgi:cytochrome d ubiquinol oxidase subunit I
MGVVSGITMSFQFGTNWPGFMERVGNIAGPLLAYEVLTAFFLEAVFLGIMLFGSRRVSARVHTLATFLVAFGTTMSCLLDPGAEFLDAHTRRASRSAMAWPRHRLAGDRLQSVHAVPAGACAARLRPDSGLPGGWPLGAALACRRPGQGHLSRAAHRPDNGRVLIPLQILAGDLHGLNTLEHQPQKIAAMEGNWETGPRVPLLLFAIPDEEARENRFELGIPGGASLILKHDIDGVVPGLNDFVAEDGTVLHPPVTPLFFAFRIMVGVGFAMLFISWIGAWMIWRRGDINRPMAYVLVPMALSGWVATLAGWYTTEIGRQPWLVDGVLKTSDAVAALPATSVGITLVAYLLVYAGLITAYLSVIIALALKAAKTPHEAPPGVNTAGINPDPAMVLGLEGNGRG